MLLASSTLVLKRFWNSIPFFTTTFIGITVLLICSCSIKYFLPKFLQKTKEFNSSLGFLKLKTEKGDHVRITRRKRQKAIGNLYRQRKNTSGTAVKNGWCFQRGSCIQAKKTKTEGHNQKNSGKNRHDQILSECLRDVFTLFKT